jgi:hypothetical protein
MSGIQSLLELARTYAGAERIELSTVSTRVFDDGKKLEALARGSDIQVGRYERAVTWFALHWPTGARWPTDIPWPADVPRPGSPARSAPAPSVPA